MLSLTVREGEYIAIGPDIVVQVLKTGDVFRLAIDAPKDVSIQRSKVLERAGEAPECIRRVRQSGTPPKAPGFKRAQRPE